MTDEIINRFKNRKNFFLKSQGTSMLPLLHAEDILYIKGESYQNIRNNDFILIKKNKHFFTHRVIYKRKTFLITNEMNPTLCTSYLSLFSS